METAGPNDKPAELTAKELTYSQSDDIRQHDLNSISDSSAAPSQTYEMEEPQQDPSGAANPKPDSSDPSQPIAPAFAQQHVSNHGHHESFSRSRVSGGASIDTAALSELLEEEPEMAWAEQDNAGSVGEDQSWEPSSLADTAEAKDMTTREPADQGETNHGNSTTEEDGAGIIQASQASATGIDSLDTAEGLQAVDADGWDGGDSKDFTGTENVPATLDILEAPKSPSQAPVALPSEVSITAPLPESVFQGQSVSATKAVDQTSDDAAAFLSSTADRDTADTVANGLPAEPPHAEPPESFGQGAAGSKVEGTISSPADQAFPSNGSIETISADPDLLEATKNSAKAEKEEEAGDGLDFGDTSAFDDEWSKALPSATDQAEQATQDFDNSQDSTIEDEWSKAFGDEAAADDPWAALGDGLDEDGFLEDEVQTPTPQVSAPRSTSSSYTPAAPSPYTPSATIMSTPSLSSQGSAPAAPRPPISAATPATPMKFFEDLPMARPPPTRRPKPQAPSASQPAPDIAPATATQGPPAGRPGPPQGSARSISSQYGSFVPPPRQDLFPPQPSVAPAAETPLTIPASMPPNSNRYSPAPPSGQTVQPQGGYSQSPSSQAPPAPSRYSPAMPAATPSANPPLQPVTAATPPYVPPTTSAGPQSSAAPPLAPPPKQNTRYSPAPTPSAVPSQQAPAAPVRSPPKEYSAAGPAPGGPPPAHRFAPRTSSPLAYSHTNGLTQGTNETPTMASEPPLESDTAASQASSSPQLPHQVVQPPPPGPRRTKTSSPEVGRSKPAGLTARSAASQPSYSPVRGNYGEASPTQPVHVLAGQHAADPSDENLIRPQDETSTDPLQRWKGSPLIQWGANGSIMTTFPTRTPRYGGGQTAPMIKCSPGEVKIRKSAATIPELSSLDSFPGPLKAKGKKKDVLAWLTSHIETLQRDQSHSELETMDSRVTERILLWQIIKVFLEHDGKLSGDPSVDLAIRQTLAPNAETGPLSGGPATTEVPNEVTTTKAIDELGQSLLRGDREKAIWHAVDNRMWAHALLISSTVNPTVWKQVVQEFVRKEVRSARVGNQSMSALYNVFAGNFDESIDELVPASARAGFQMMSTQGSSQQQNALEGLNKWQETLGLILSNRSTDDEKSILSLGKLLSNYGRVEAAHVCYLFSRSIAGFNGADDPAADFTLLGAAMSGKDSAYDLDHIILSEVYEFALSLSANQTPAYYIPHLQAYKLRHAYSLAENGSRNKALQYCDAITSALKSTTKLSAYYHPLLVSTLDDLSKRLAQIPKDGSSGWMTKPSIEKVSGSMWARFNSFVAGDDSGDASSTGSAAHSDGEAGPFGRVAGTPSLSRTGSVSEFYGSTPASSQAQPPGIMNSRYAPNATTQASGYATSPYTPNAASQRMSMYNEARNVSDPTGYQPSGNVNHRPSSQHSNYTPSAVPQVDTPSYASQLSTPQDSYVPSIPEEPRTAIPRFDSPANSSVDMSNPYAPSPVLSFTGSTDLGDEPKANGYIPRPNGFPQRSTSFGPPPEQQAAASNDSGKTSSELQSSSYDPSASSYEPSQSSYEPSSGEYDPSGGSYEPPQSSGGYQPYQPEPGSPEASAKPKKGIMYDDEDSFAPHAQAGPTRAEKDRAADEAFRKAAEEDAKRDAAAKKESRSSWFGGWLGAGKKEPNAPTVHKAKLGEENSFVFDPVTKKWVNKKAGAGDQQSTPAAATPPPPRAGPPTAGPPMSRNITPSGPPMAPRGGTPGPAPGPASRAGTPGSQGAGPAESNELGVPPTLQQVAGIGPPGSGPPSSGPPSRPATSMSNASSIDDLLGAPAPRKGGTVKKGKKGGRYVDVMAK